ncbi:MAG: TSUP family transporter [Sphingomonas sp.]
MAIGTSALAVAANAATGLASHACARTVKVALRRDLCRAGIIGALIGSTAGKAFDRWKLLFLFALVMVVVGLLMLRGRKAGGDPGA